MKEWVNKNIHEIFESVTISKHTHTPFYELCIVFKNPIGLCRDNGNELYIARSLKYAKQIFYKEWNTAKDRKRANWVRSK